MLLVPFFRGLARHLHLACLALTAATAAVFAQTTPSTAADGFDPNVDGNVFAMVAQGDGKLLVVGQFNNVAPNGGIGVARHNIARFNSDGSFDGSFDPNADGAVRAVALQPDGKIVIGGDFSTVGGVARNRIARLNADGSVDTTFSPSIGSTLSSTVPATNPQVFALAVQPDGHIVVGGSFGSVKPSASTSAVARNNIARFDSKGAVDAFNPNANAMVLAIALHVSNKIIIGGAFTQLTSPQPTTRLHVARLNADGTTDSEFNPQANDGVTAIAVQQDGKILLGGYFTTLQPPTDSSPAPRFHLGRLNVDGTLDSEFYPTVGGNVFAIAVGPDGGIYIGGHFTQVYGRNNVAAVRSYAAKLTLDGTVDDTFNPNPNADVDAFAFQADGKVIVGGYFTRVQPAALSSAVVRNHMARYLPDGTLDTAFQVDAGGRVLASVTQNDGSVVIAGTFTNVGGQARYFIARLKADGTLDASYNPTLNGPVYSLAYDSSANKVLAGGSFTALGTSSDISLRSNLVRLNPDGTVDSEFNPNPDGAVAVIVRQSDGTILIGGGFNFVKPFGTTDPVARAHIARLTNAGQLDATFYPNTNGNVNAIGVQSDGKIVIGGAFTALQPNASGNVEYRNYLARLNKDGTVDSSYNPNPNAPVSALVVQSDDSAVVGGRFTDFVPPGATALVLRDYLARVKKDGSIDANFDPHPNGLVLALALQGNQIVVGGAFTIFQPAGQTNWTQAKYIGRLNADGTVDTGFNLDLNELFGNRVDSITVSNGDLLVGGTFVSLQPTGSASRVLRNHFARIKANGTLDTAFNPGAGGTTSAVVNAIAVETNGQVIVGGSFNDLGGAAATNIAQFNQEGSPDHTFNTALSTDGPVNALAIRANGAYAGTQLAGFAWLTSAGALNTTFRPTQTFEGRINTSLVQPDGKVIVAGSYSDVTANGTRTNGNIARFNADGSVDWSFSATLVGAVYGMIRQPNGQIIIYGNFSSVDGATRNHIARLNADGTLDTTFDPNPNGYVSSAVLQSDGGVVLGGGFTTLSANGAATATTRNYIARVNSGGALDTAYDPNLNASVSALALQGDGKVVVGGAFTSAQPNATTTATTRNRIARLNSDGTLDTSFDPNANDVVSALLVQSNGQVVIGGSFTTIANTTRYGIARLNSNGALDGGFTAAANSAVTSLAQAADGSYLIGGLFTTVTESGGSTPVARYHFARISSAGALDSTFNPDLAGNIGGVTIAPNGSVLVGGTFTTLQPAGVILVGGNFTTVGGVALRNLAQLNGDGSVNAAFQPKPDGAVTALLALADGRFLVGGAFTTISGAGRQALARFNADGTLDAAFNPTVSGSVASVAVQADGKVLVGANSLFRLNTDGSVDSSFKAAAPFVPATALAVQPDGKIIVAGTGSGVPMRIMRLNADGSVDTSFATVSFSGGTDVRTLTLQTDGKIIVAGSFTSIGGQAISNLARLNTNGSVDNSFNPAPNAAVNALALQSDGRLMIGGAFTTIGAMNRVALARVSNTGPAAQAIGVSSDGHTITLLRSGTVGEISGVSFEWSADGQAWTTLGVGTRIANTSNWQITGVNGLPLTTAFFIRAREVVPTSAGKSNGAYQVVQMVDLNSPVTSTATTIAMVQTSSPWDATHYVWTLDAAGVLRIADAFTAATLDASSTALVGSTSHPVAASGAHLADLSTRGIVKADAPLIGGFAVVGTAPRAVLIRAIGPGLSPFGVTNYLKNPQLRIFDSTNALVTTNSGWNATLSADFARTGAFPLTPGSADSAIVTTLKPGTYTVQVADGDGASSAGGDALIEIYDAGNPTDTSARLVNLSARGTIGSNGTLIGGLYVAGSAPKTVLVRGIGPSLAKYGVGGVLADPVVAVYNGSGDLVASNDNWQVSDQPSSLVDYGAAMSGAASSISAFPFDQGSKDAALVITLPAGAYSVQVKGANGGGGAAMLEVYELP